jgi:3D (Asp-Asp-Asp) domain-containing protein
VLYIPELDGITMPGRSPYGGFVHDGCVMADDRGGNVRGNQIDFFAARRAYYKRLQKQHRLKKVTVFEGGAKCRRLAERIAVGPGAI